jgi:hypothetical protein
LPSQNLEECFGGSGNFMEKIKEDLRLVEKRLSRSFQKCGVSKASKPFQKIHQKKTKLQIKLNLFFI